MYFREKRRLPVVNRHSFTICTCGRWGSEVKRSLWGPWMLLPIQLQYSRNIWFSLAIAESYLMHAWPNHNQGSISGSRSSASGQPVNPLFFNIFLFVLESSRKQSAESKTVPPRSELRRTPDSFDGASCPPRGIYRLPDYIYYGHFLCLAGENEETTWEHILVLIASILQPTQF